MFLRDAPDPGTTSGWPWRLVALALLTLAMSGQARAEPDAAETEGPRIGTGGRGGKLLLTGGVSTIDGAAGGGLTPWAVTGTQADQGQWGLSAFTTGVSSQDFSLRIVGIAASVNDRVEVSLARQSLDTGSLLSPLSVGFDGLKLKMTVAGVKFKVSGDAVLDADRWQPQVAVGAQYKSLDAGAFEPVLAGALGARMSDTDVYVAVTKLFLAQGILANATVRYTRANQNGLLGFGSADRDRHELQSELSLAWLFSRNWVVGAEYRFKPDNLRNTFAPGALREEDWWDLFVAWAPNKQLSLTAAFVSLGTIAPALQPRRQKAGYLSAQIAY